jgi:hypothetical protein
MALNRKHDRCYAKRDQAGDRGRDKLPSFHAPLSPLSPQHLESPTSVVAFRYE